MVVLIGRLVFRFLFAEEHTKFREVARESGPSPCSDQTAPILNGSTRLAKALEDP